tara:strand:+ start:156 stop:707 length:552 start_codon:yes stop_codon:yes gene_type:complete
LEEEFMLNIKLDEATFLKSVKFHQENNIGMRGHADGSKEEQLTGIIGQNIICLYLGKPFMVAEGFDGGVDITLNDTTIDIKTMGRNVYPKSNYVNNLMASQLKYNVDNYLFCSYHKKDKVLTICGWIDKQGFKDKAEFYKEGMIRTRTNGTALTTKSDLYEIENKDLNEINNYKDLLSVGIVA